MLLKSSEFCSTEKPEDQEVIRSNLQPPINRAYIKPYFQGMGFCEFETPEACQSAIDGLNGYELQGRQLRVDHARQRN